MRKKTSPPTPPHRGGGQRGDGEKQYGNGQSGMKKNKKYSSSRLREGIGKDLISSWLNTEKEMFVGYPPPSLSSSSRYLPSSPHCPPPLWGGAGGEVYMFPKKFVADIEFIGKTIYTLSSGTKIGVMKGKDFIPSLDFAHSVEININNFTVWAVDRITALKFLKRETLYAPADINKGYVLLTYLGVPLGWVKNIGTRCNNMLPQNRRILD
jgi:NOL1/NOP2/fmu family ribosome biogenesis protein